MNGQFQAASLRSIGYRNTMIFITMVYLMAAPLGNLIQIHIKRRGTKIDHSG